MQLSSSFQGLFTVFSSFYYYSVPVAVALPNMLLGLDPA